MADKEASVPFYILERQTWMSLHVIHYKKVEEESEN